MPAQAMHLVRHNYEHYKNEGEDYEEYSSHRN
jgi:hypothetical protein